MGITPDRWQSKMLMLSKMKVIIIISIFEEDRVYTMTANLPYGPPVNIDNNYFQTFCK